MAALDMFISYFKSYFYFKRLDRLLNIPDIKTLLQKNHEDKVIYKVFSSRNNLSKTESDASCRLIIDSYVDTSYTRKNARILYHIDIHTLHVSPFKDPSRKDIVNIDREDSYNEYTLELNNFLDFIKYMEYFLICSI